MAPCVFSPEFQNNVSFEIVINTNLIKPGLTSGNFSDASFKQIDINGGKQFTISGKSIKIPINLPDSKNTNPGDFTQALADRNYWTMYVLDSRNWDGNPGCSAENPIISTNAQVASTPTFDPKTKEILLRVSSPHLSPDGTNPEIGDFQAIMTTSGITCLWGVSAQELNGAAQLSITYENGISNLALLTTSLDKNIFTIRASGFHYSSPTLHLKFNEPKSASLPNKIAKNKSVSEISIKCVKGKIRKSVSGLKATCTVGFTKV
jgi:hypothetical protein